ncbi:hypothetical protein SERLA73DRAFT_57868 [Serpula lacrymans var. lacrymans S7.3]|uniref:DUF6589 domain-containing protein n=1 Tax=Serpula lacrymans var. lacrymans (strain S7.3) TaxID=936435 RepID=F8Q4U1_SERL3|nr:hypothetical protein SERLA73DRAFT_57868 [Serpula lacrymans var. lacrymans S7.3]
MSTLKGLITRTTLIVGYRAVGRKTPLNIEEIYSLEQASAPSRQAHNIHCVLQYLIHSPDFQLQLYKQCNNPIFGAPPPVRQLPTGLAFITEQYMLGTVHIEEASYDGNNKLLVEWFKQLGLHLDEQQQKTGLERVIPWVGNQLTVECLWGLY